MRCVDLFSFVVRSGSARWRLGLRLLAALIVCVLAGWGVRNAFLARQLDALAQQSRQHAAFHRTGLDSLLTRNESLPRIVDMENRLRELLLDPANERKLAAANDYLLEVKERAGINTVYLMDKNGLTLAASNHGQPGTYVGHNYEFRPYFQAAMAGRLGIFYGVGATTGEPGYFLATPIKDEAKLPLGVVVVKIRLEDFEAMLQRNGTPFFLVDTNGVVLLASFPELKYHFLAPLEPGALRQIDLSRQYGEQTLRPLGMQLRLQDEPQYLRAALPGGQEEDYLAVSTQVGRLQWSIVLLSQTRQERQSALLAGISAGLAVAFLLSLAIFYRLNVDRYKERRQAEIALRQAHADLEKRIAERTTDLRATNATLEERVAALKTTETVLRETRDAAVQAGKLAVLGQMAAGISHEVNQPLTAMHTFADNAVDLLERGELNEVRENLGLIRQMVVRMAHIVGDIKNFARRTPSEGDVVKVAGVVDQALMLVDARRKHVEARIDTQGIPGDLRAIADLQRLEQVLVNLLLNALDAVAGTAQRRIIVLAERCGGRVSILVRDSGPGIPDDILPHLFEPFFTTKTAGRGIGLGLAISRMITAELGGSLEVRNHEEGGAEFTVTLEGA
jgi:two-component system C4-dicarboxylate transport sensor histidine kinase DctB